MSQRAPSILPSLLAACAAVGFGLPASATAAEALPVDPVAAPGVVAGEVLVRMRGEPGERLVRLRRGETLAAGLARLEADHDVRWAEPNAVARAAWIPRDPGRAKRRGGWVEDQWNFLAPPARGTTCTPDRPCGVDAPRAWRLLRKAGVPRGRRANGKRGPIIAVVDSGVAFRNKGERFRKSPDLARGAFVPGRDFVGAGPPLDLNGHGTHVASTIIERTDNDRAVTGLGDGLRVMPVRVLDKFGTGSARNVARGIRWAARHGARVINLSLQFNDSFDSCEGLRAVCRAIRKARRRGALVVAAAGNDDLPQAQMPALVATAVASTTIRGCLSRWTSFGADIDLSAPGGGQDKRRAGSHCRPDARGPGIVQLTLRTPGRTRRFGYPRYEGTSMAAPHVSAAAGLVLSSRVLRRELGRRPSPDEIETWLRCTARPVPSPGGQHDTRYGAGILDLASAVDRRSGCPPLGIAPG